MNRGGNILAAGDPLARVQLIDVRDMAAWIIQTVERGGTGTFNVTGPTLPMGWAEMLGALRGTTSRAVMLTWVPTNWVLGRSVPSDSNLLYWPTEIGEPGLMHMIIDKAASQGLSFRPLNMTAADTLSWYLGEPEDRRAQLLMGLNGSAAIEDSLAREQEILSAWHTHRMTTSGR